MADQIVKGQVYNTIYGRAKYLGLQVREVPLADDKSDKKVHVFSFIEAKWEVPEAHIARVNIVKSLGEMTRMISPDDYLPTLNEDLYV